jgi:ADP-ribosylglycohydrolase/fructose-1,6-bisphosphatase/inositol monophosphatase family enzyme
MSDLAAALSAAVEAAREAGALLRDEFHRPGGPRGHGGRAEIDRPAEEAIRARLLAAFPWNYLGEETGRAGPGAGPFLWLVDPNDGTAAYLKGWRGSAVSIAALRDGQPVLGVVYAFCYPDGDGDLFAWAEGCPLTRNGRPVNVNLAECTLEGGGGLPALVFVSQDADVNPDANARCARPARHVKLASIAHRLARVAAGDGVAAVSLSSPCSWDYAAGHALLRGAGGTLVNERGEEVAYSPAGESSSSWCFGGSPASVRDLCQRDWDQVHTPVPAPAPPYALVTPRPGRAVADADRLSRAQGCLLGQLAGDSLGGLVEFRSLTTIRDRYPDGLRDLADGGTWRNLAGQPTDDSEMALSLARMLVHRGGYDRGAALDAYAHWWPEAWDRGGTLSQALSPAARADTTAERLALVEERASRSSQSNGCLMRISPLGIFGAGSPAEAADWARADAALTHPHPVCRESCAAYVAAVATAVGTGSPAEDCYRAALAEADRPDVPPEVRRALEEARHGPPADYQTHMGWVLIALQNAFYQLLHAPTLEEGVVNTVMRGGDTDTTAAIAGALLGAVHGRQAVPTRWLLALLSCRTLEDSGTAHPQPPYLWPVDALELAEALLAAGKGP